MMLSTVLRKTIISCSSSAAQTTSRHSVTAAAIPMTNCIASVIPVSYTHLLFERIYEDNVSGKLSDDRFAKMSRRYEEEQKELSEKIKKLRSKIEKQSSRATSTDMFVSIVRKYTRARKLTPRMLNELVEKIEVYNAEKIDGEWVQRLRIHYNCVGEMNIPNEPALPIPAVTVNTRKGVFVSYTTDDRPAV